MTVAELGPVCKSVKGHPWCGELKAWQMLQWQRRKSPPVGPRRLATKADRGLQYWNTLASFEKKESPKGSIPLLGITRIYLDENNKTEVVVKYANSANSDPVWLRLSFPSHMSAEQWRKDLRQIRATL
eukprot:g19683.t1